MIKQPSQHLQQKFWNRVLAVGMEQKREIWERLLLLFCLYLSSGNYIVLYCLFMVSKGFIIRAVVEFKVCHLLAVRMTSYTSNSAGLIFSICNLEIIVSTLWVSCLCFQIMRENGSTQCLAHSKNSIHCNYYSYQLAPFFYWIEVLKERNTVSYLLQCLAPHNSLHGQNVFANLRDGGIVKTWQLILVDCK